MNWFTDTHQTCSNNSCRIEFCTSIDITGRISTVFSSTPWSSHFESRVSFVMLAKRTPQWWAVAVRLGAGRLNTISPQKKCSVVVTKSHICRPSHSYKCSYVMSSYSLLHSYKCSYVMTSYSLLHRYKCSYVKIPNSLLGSFNCNYVITFEISLT
jgi:hypothetical protein